MVGQIRDSETADIAVKAALSGQFILSSLQENDAISNISRLIEMGVEPFLVASSLVMLCTQRLARKICFKCRKPIDIPKDFLEKIKFSGKTKFYSAQGCKYCNNSGIYGRIAILEAVLINDTVREMIIKKQSLDAIREYCVTQLGMKMLRDDAFIKVRDGMATLEEAIRITTEE